MGNALNAESLCGHVFPKGVCLMSLALCLCSDFINFITRSSWSLGCLLCHEKLHFNKVGYGRWRLT